MRIFDHGMVRNAMAMSIALVLAPPMPAQMQRVRLIIPDTLESGSRVVGQVDFGPGFSPVRRDYVIDWGGDEGLRSEWSDFSPNPHPAYFIPGKDGYIRKTDYVALGRPGRRPVILTVHDEFGRTTADTVHVTVVERALSLGIFWPVKEGGFDLLFPSSSPGWRYDAGPSRDTLRLAVATRDSSEYDALQKATYRLGRTTALCCGRWADSPRLLETGYKALPPIAVYFAWSDLQRNRDLPVGSTSIIVTGSMPMNGVSARFRATMTMRIVARRAAAKAGAYR